MIDIIRLVIIFILILILLRKRLNVGYVLMIASGVLASFYFMKPQSIYLVIKNTLTSEITLKLIIALTFIRVFEFILREKGLLEKMMESIKGIFRNKKAVIISMPLLVGMLPSIGGAYFSAPMVREATKELSLTPEKKSFANYWYRHPWEFILPLYPGIVLASVLTSIELRKFIILNMPYAVIMFLVGFWFLRDIRGGFESKRSVSRVGVWSFLPIILLLIFVIGFHLELHYALVLIVSLLFIFFRYSFKNAVKTLRHGFSKDVVVLILGVMLFKEALEVSGAVGNISYFFSENKIPLLPIIFILPLVAGLLTGITVGFVGSTFPLIINIAGIDPRFFTFAFASGFIGVLLSPVHVCLILTREYFKADMIGIFRKTVPACGFILVVALIEFMLL